MIGIKKWNSRQPILPKIQLNSIPIVNFSNKMRNTTAEYQTEDAESFKMQTISQAINSQPTISEMDAINVIEQLPNAGMLIGSHLITGSTFIELYNSSVILYTLTL